MLKIKTNKGYLDLGGDFTVQIDEKSPIMNDRGSQTVPVTVPCTNNNALITGFAHRLDMAMKPIDKDATCTVLDGVYKRTGKLNIVSAGKKEGITLNIGFDNSEAYSAWKAKKLNSITLPTKEFSSVNSLCTHLQQVLNGYQTDYSVFQIMTANDSKDNQYYPKYLNYIIPISEGSNIYKLRYQTRTETFLVNDTPTATTLPEGYGVTAFLYVWRVLEFIFSEFGYTITENPFKKDKQLYNLVILNNAADCCVKGKLAYADLMPDCTVEEFLNALYVRFGLVYSISSDTKTATLRLLKDIIVADAGIDLSKNLTAEPLITYETAKQVKLSAKTSFTGAAPSVERFEDYIKENKKLIVRIAKYDPSNQVGWINYEKTTGKWYKWDTENKRLTYSSSSFFNWDSKTDDVEDNEITSDDECVPMDFAPNGILSPQYLAGYVHRYTYLKTSSNNDDEDSEKEEIPLSFMFSFVTAQNRKYPFGSILPYTPEGEEIILSNGSKQTISLLFQFPDGLFAQFWQKYDAVLRHSFNQVEVNALLYVYQLMKVDTLNPVSLRGQQMLWDGLSYSLPASNLVPTTITMRSLRLIGPYDLDSEQNIPTWNEGSWVWIANTSTLNAVIDSRLDYWEEYHRYEIGWAVYGSRLSAIKYDGYVTPETDEDILTNPPTSQEQRITKTYKCRIDLEILVNDRSGAPSWWYPESEEINYQVTFIPKLYQG